MLAHFPVVGFLVVGAVWSGEYYGYGYVKSSDLAAEIYIRYDDGESEWAILGVFNGKVLQSMGHGYVSR